MRHNTIALVSWSLAGAAATALLIGTGTHDPAAPAEAYAPVRQEHPVTIPPTVPAGDFTIVAPLDVTGEAPIICGPWETLNLAGDGCVNIPRPGPQDPPPVGHAHPLDVIEYFEDGSWRNHTTGESGCTRGAPCDAPEIEIVDTPPMEATDRVEFFEDGSWRNHSDGTTGCTPGALCDD